MANVSEAREAKRQDGLILSYSIKEDESIYKGTFVCVAADGYAIQGSDTAALKLVGMAVEDSTGADSADGERNIRVFKTGCYEVNTAADLGQGSVGTLVYISDNNTVDKKGTTANDILAGQVVEYLDTTTVRIDISYATAYSPTDAT